MCGDGFQSIFLFRGADLNLFTSIVEAGSFGPKKIEVNRLVVNFRSLPGVVQWNNETYQEVFKGSAYEFVRRWPCVRRGRHVCACPRYWPSW